MGTRSEKKLTQIVGNLLSNACKYTPKHGSIKLTASAAKIENKSVTLQIEVIDNGIGIAKEHERTLFTPFEQVDGGISRKFGGAGLGLPISKHLVEIMDGRIWFESEPDKGSKFAFAVKLQIKTAETGNGSLVSFENKTLLLVDDVDINREIVIAILEDTKIEIKCAENGQEALELFSSDPAKYDAILMDINMPEMDGVEATRRIRIHDSPEGARVPIIAMTANVLPDEVAKYLYAGMNDHISKPVDFDMLLRLLDKYINR